MRNKIAFLLIFTISFCFSQVGISTTSPHISAELDVSSTSRGLLLPRLTTAAITSLTSSASEGLVVFNTDTKQFLGWDGTKWQVLGNVSSGTFSAGWEFGGLVAANNYGASPFPGSVTQITSANLIRGSGVTLSGTPAAGGWGGNGFDSTTLSNAISNNDFATVTIIIPSTNVFSFSKILANNMKRSANGPTNGQWQYSLNGTTYVDIIGFTTDTGSLTVPEINLSAISALQNLSNTTVYFRIVLYGASSSTGNFYINNLTGSNDLEIQGIYN